MSEEKQINLLKYDYPTETVVQIPGKMLYGIMQLLNQVKDSETTQTSFISQFPKSSKKVFNKDDKKLLEKVEVEWEVYPTALAYFEQTPVESTSLLGVMATDLLMLIQQAHLDNINNGLAVQVGTFKEETKDEVKLS